MATLAAPSRRGVRVAEGAALEMPYTGNRIGGSNPPLSAFHMQAALSGFEHLGVEARHRSASERKNQSQSAEESVFETIGRETYPEASARQAPTGS